MKNGGKRERKNAHTSSQFHRHGNRKTNARHTNSYEKIRTRRPEMEFASESVLPTYRLPQDDLLSDAHIWSAIC